MVRHKRRHGLRLHSVFLWHRYFGLTAALFVVTLAVSGILINYSDALQLSKKHIQADWLLDWYGIATPTIDASYPVGTHWVAQVGERIYFDSQEIDDVAVPLHGAIQITDKVAIATGDQLLLLTPQGEMIDRMGGAEGIPDGVQAVGTLGTKLMLHTTHGDYQTDEQFLVWKPSAAVRTRWADSAPLPETLRNALIRQYRGMGVSWERLLLDLHSGRLFGKIGVWVMNIAAVLMLLLAITGVWHFFQRKRR
jgi:hypothetical protein